MPKPHPPPALSTASTTAFMLFRTEETASVAMSLACTGRLQSQSATWPVGLTRGEVVEGSLGIVSTRNNLIHCVAGHLYLFLVPLCAKDSFKVVSGIKFIYYGDIMTVYRQTTDQGLRT